MEAHGDRYIVEKSIAKLTAGLVLVGVVVEEDEGCNRLDSLSEQ